LLGAEVRAKNNERALAGLTARTHPGSLAYSKRKSASLRQIRLSVARYRDGASIDHVVNVGVFEYHGHTINPFPFYCIHDTPWTGINQ
jgi:hypothetical protein